MSGFSEHEHIPGLFGHSDLDFQLNSNRVNEQLEELKQEYGDQAYSRLIYKLTRLRFDPEESRQHWQLITKHYMSMSRALERDVGIFVAVCDYFMNVRRELGQVTIIDSNLLEKKEKAALVDELTGLYNRRFFNQILIKQATHSERTRDPVSLLVLDIDNFKAYNDTYGHMAGDKVLMRLAKCLLVNSRTIDYVARYGGDEFALILPQVPKNEGLLVAERLRRAIEIFFSEDPMAVSIGGITVSIGVATLLADASDSLEIFQLADQALYKGKLTRNCVMGWEPEKRSHPRYPVDLPMELRVSDNDPESFESAVTRDLSLGGLLCRVNRSMSRGEQLEVVLKPGGDLPSVTIQATVARLVPIRENDSEYYLGLAFKTISDSDRQILDQMIAELNPRMQ